jgi:hypothetical protein
MELMHGLPELIGGATARDGNFGKVAEPMMLIKIGTLEG